MKNLVLSAALVLVSPVAVIATAAPASAQDWAVVGCRDANCARDYQQARQAQTDPGDRPGNYGGGYYPNGVAVVYENSTTAGRTKRSDDPVNGKQFCRYREWSSWIPINQVCPGAPAPQVVAAPPASANPVVVTGAPFHLEGNLFVRDVLNPDGKTYRRETVPVN